MVPYSQRAHRLTKYSRNNNNSHWKKNTLLEWRAFISNFKVNQDCSLKIQNFTSKILRLNFKKLHQNVSVKPTPCQNIRGTDLILSPGQDYLSLPLQNISFPTGKTKRIHFRRTCETNSPPWPPADLLMFCPFYLIFTWLKQLSGPKGTVSRWEWEAARPCLLIISNSLLKKCVSINLITRSALDPLLLHTFEAVWLQTAVKITCYFLHPMTDGDQRNFGL